jgi:hypothetical protein
MTMTHDEQATREGAQPAPPGPPDGRPGRLTAHRRIPREGSVTHVADPGQTGWLTTVLRPAGTLDQPALNRLSAALGHVAASTDMVIVDLTAADVTAPRALAQRMRAPARQLQQADGFLLVVGAPPGLMAELGRATVPVTAFASGSLPLPPA